MKRCVLIGFHISTSLPVKKLAWLEENNMAETERDFSEDEFSAALVEALRNFHNDSLIREQIECLRRVICLREDVLAVLPTSFEQSLIYQIIPKVLECLKNESEDRNKFIVCAVSPLEYIRKQHLHLSLCVILRS